MIRLFSIACLSGLLLYGCGTSKPGSRAGSRYAVTVPGPAVVQGLAGENAYHCLGEKGVDTVFVENTFADSLHVGVFIPRFDAVGTTGGLGMQEHDFSGPADITATNSATGETRLLITDTGNRRLSLFSSAGDFLFTVPVEAGEEPVSAVAMGSGMYLVVDRALRTLVSIDRFGKYGEQIGSLCGRPMSNRCMVRPGRFNRILCVDSQNDRVLCLDTRGRCIQEFSRAGGLFLSKPVDACIFENAIYVLDKGNNRVAGMRENGSFAQAAKTLQHAAFMVPCDGLLLIVSEDGRSMFFDADLHPGPIVSLGKQFIAGTAVGQRRLALLSHGENLLFLFELRFDKAGEAWARRLP